MAWKELICCIYTCTATMRNSNMWVHAVLVYVPQHFLNIHCKINFVRHLWLKVLIHENFLLENLVLQWDPLIHNLCTWHRAEPITQNLFMFLELRFFEAWIRPLVNSWAPTNCLDLVIGIVWAWKLPLKVCKSFITSWTKILHFKS